MNKSWEIKKLLEISNVSTGKWDANHAIDNGDYRFYTCAYDYLYCDTKRFSGECLILPGNGVNVGEVFYYNGEFDAYQRTYVLSDIKILPKYLHYHMMHFWKELGTKKQYGSATNFIKIGNFQEYNVAFPPVSEQKRIVKILDEAFVPIDKAKANAEKNLQNSRELFDSYLNKVFANLGKDWEEKKLADVCEVKDGTHDSPRYVNDEDAISFITQKNILNSGLSFEKTNFISKTNHDNFYRRSNVAYNDILISMIGANRGMACVVDNRRTFSIKNVGLIKSNNSYLSEFMLYFLKSKYAKQYIQKSSKGSAQGFIGLGKLRNFPILLPHLSTQKKIVNRVSEILTETKKLETIYQQKLADLDELKKSILQKAFDGELARNNG